MKKLLPLVFMTAYLPSLQVGYSTLDPARGADTNLLAAGGRRAVS